MTESDDTVGYGRPPRHSRFQKGRSGNPAGRPRGVKNMATLLGRSLNERVTIIENGRRRSISKLEAAIKQLVNKAATGELRSIQQLLNLVQLVEGRDDPQAAPVLTAADRQVIAELHRRLTGAGGGNS